MISKHSIAASGHDGAAPVQIFKQTDSIHSLLAKSKHRVTWRNGSTQQLRARSLNRGSNNRSFPGDDRSHTCRAILLNVVIIIIAVEWHQICATEILLKSMILLLFEGIVFIESYLKLKKWSVILKNIYKLNNFKFWFKFVVSLYPSIVANSIRTRLGLDFDKLFFPAWKVDYGLCPTLGLATAAAYLSLRAAARGRNLLLCELTRALWAVAAARFLWLILNGTRLRGPGE